MKKNFAKFMETIYLKEGYYSDHGWDTGGETLFGISRIHNQDWVGWKVFDSFKIDGIIPSKDKVFPILKDNVEDLYKTKYWDTCKCDELPSGVDLFVSDCCVNPGDYFARYKLQRAVGAYPDGVVGPRTVAAINKANPKRLLETLHDLRGVYYAMESNPRTREKAIKGWITRNRSVYEECLTMLYQ